jgi:hypothetical protein
LKGLNLTIDQWRPGHDKQGWKDKDWYDDFPMVGAGEGNKDAPEFVTVVPHLQWDLKALKGLLEGDAPAVQSVRPSIQIDVQYSFDNASSLGFGGSLLLPSGTSYRIGIWGSDTEDLSSNYRELCNFMETLEAEVKAGNLENCEIFMMTDNSTAEACFTGEH